MMHSPEDLERSLTNITPSDRQVLDIENLRGFAKNYGIELFATCPESRERSLAITKLEESVMWAVKSILMEGAGL